MYSNWKMILPAFVTSLVAVTSSVNAVDDMQMRNLENRVTALEQRRGANGMINPPARPVVKDGLDLWIEAEALFMHATEDGLDYAFENSSTDSYADGHTKNLNYDWSWGFRLGAGYHLPHDGWDLFANWTWFRTHEHEDKGTDSSEYFGGSKEYPSSSLANFHAEGADAHVHLHMNILDVEMGREFFVSKWLTLRPHVGVRGAWIKRHTEVEYDGISVDGVAHIGAEVENDFHCRFRGAGLRGGFDSQWGLGSGWSIYGQTAFSLLYGSQKVTFDQENSDVEQAEARDRWQNVRGIADFALGIRWDYLFGQDSYRIRLQAGWEQHLFFGFHQDMVFVDNVGRHEFVNNSGDLALSGVSFQARFDF